MTSGTAPRWVSALFYGVATPVAALGRPLWRRRLGLDFEPRARTYWRDRGREVVKAESMRSQR